MVRISWEEYQRIKDLKELDIQVCEFGHLNILNLGWKPFGEFYCIKHEKKHVLCPELCSKACLNILKCELVRKRKKTPEKPEVAVNQKHYKSNCYLCFKELKGAGRHGVVKNRNNPGFWGLKVAYKILCLECVGKKYYRRMKDWQRKKFREYRRRGYV